MVSGVTACADRTGVMGAARGADRILSVVNGALRTAPMNIPQDPRLRTPIHSLYSSVFKVEAGVRGLRQIQTIKTHFRFMQGALASATLNCTSADDAMCGKRDEIGHAAYAAVGFDASTTIHLCPGFFRESRPRQARTLIHELAHARVGTEHKGGRFVHMDACSATPVKTSDEAINNAYVYDTFASCIQASRASRPPGGVPERSVPRRQGD